MPHEAVTLYWRVQTTTALQMPVTLWKQRAFLVADQWALLGQGLYFGLMFVMILYNSFIYTVVRDRSYLFYVLFVSCFTLLQLCLQGVAYQYLWPTSPRLNETILAASVSSALAFGGLFTIRLLSLRSASSLLYRLIMLLAVLGFANALASAMFPYTTTMFISFGLLIPICLLSLVAGITRWWQDYTPARYYTVAWLVLLLGTLVFVLNKMGALPRNTLTENILQVGSALEVVLLSFALAERINVARRQTVSILEKYQALYENAIEGIFQTTLGYDIVSANRAMATMLGAATADQLMVSEHANLQRFFGG